MKKLLFITLLLIPCLGFSQTTKPIEGFLGIKFGSSKDEVIAAMKAKGYKPGVSNNNSDPILDFGSITYGHRQTTEFGVKFVDNKAYQAVFIFKADEEPKTIIYYNNLINDINENYGPGDQHRIFRSPYADGDGDEITAISGGYADYFTNWFDSNKNDIQVKITSEMNVIVFYTNGTLADQAKAKAKEKEKGDY